MNGVLLGARCLLAAVFLLAAVGKVRDRAGTRDALVAFGVAPSLIAPGATVLPLAELVSAVALLLSPSAVAGAALAIVLLTLFTVAIGRELAAGRAPQCQCFGQLQSEPIGVSSLVRNLLLIAFAAVTVAGGGGPSLSAALTGLHGAQVGLVAVSVALAAALVLALWLIGERTRLRAEVTAALESRLPLGLDPGTVAPEFELDSLSDGPRTLAELLTPGLPVVLVFVSGTCGPCRALMPSLGRWRESISERVTLATVFEGDRESALRLTESHGLPAALIQPRSEVSRSYRLKATPTAVLVEPDATIGSTPAEGEIAIEALVRSALAGSERPQLVIQHA